MPEAAKIPSRYEVLSELGSGGMGAVYKVRDRNLDAVFALKLLKFPNFRKEQALRFQKEAQASGALRHKKIVSIVDFGISNEQVPYMVLEFVEGQTLKELLTESGPLPLEQALPIFEQIALALAYAHDKGVVHRDLKSSNILITSSDQGGLIAKIFDFGIAKIMTVDKKATFTPRNTIIGTPAYMSPEQSSGARSDGRSDIYSFGCVMFETLTGTVPFVRNTALELVKAHANQSPPRLSEMLGSSLPDGIEEIVDTCLRKNKEDRYASARILYEKLQGLEGGHNESESVPELSNRSVATSADYILGNRKPINFSNMIALGGLCLLVLALLGLILGRDSASTSKVRVTAPPQPVSTEKAVAVVYNEEFFLARRSKSDNGYKLDFSNDDTVSVGVQSIPDWRICELLLPSTLPLTQSVFQKIATIKTLSKLELKGAKIHGASISALQKLPRLTTLDISEANVDEPACRAIAKLPSLQRLCLNDVVFSSIEAIRALKNPAFHSLEIIDSKMGDKELEVLCGLSKLRGLDLANMHGTMSGIAPLSKLENLTHLHVKRFPLSNANIEVIAKLKKLKHLSFEYVDPVDLANLHKLSSLDLEHLEIKNSPSIKKNFSAVLGCIKRMPSLWGVGLAGNELGDDEISQLGLVKKLKSIAINNNSISDRGLLNLVKTSNLERISVSGISSTEDEKFKRANPKRKLFVETRVDIREEDSIIETFDNITKQ